MFLAWLLLPTFSAQAWQPPSTPERWVTDQTGFLSATTAAALDRNLAAHAQSNGQQVLLWIGATTDGVPLEEWAVRTFQSWGVGRKGLDDGVVIFVLVKDRRVRIEVGYGLEPKLPDVRAAAIIRELFTPRLAKGDRDGAAQAAVGAVLDALAGQPGAAVETTPSAKLPQLSWIEWTLLAVFVLLFGILLITHPGLAAYLLITMATGGRHRSGGGGFSGGGGRSGGGGASGSW